MSKPDLLLICGVTDRMMDRLTAEFSVHPVKDIPDLDAFLDERGSKITAVATDGHLGLKTEVMDRLPNLKIVSSYGVGYDAIDATAAMARGVVVTHTPDVLNDEVADTAIMLWLAVSRQLVVNDNYVRSGRWEAEGNAPLSRSIQNRTVGILGLGRIGQTIASRASMFNATILYHTLSAKDVPYTYCADLVDMARQSDVVICITPGGPETQHLVNRDVLDALGPEGTLINVSRGSVVDEAALVEALQDGRLGAAGLDVFEEEPSVPAALLGMENVVLQPHVGSATVETRQAMGDLTCDNLSQYLKDGTTLTPVPECCDL